MNAQSNSKVILVLVDGLAWQTAHDGMGYLQGLCAAGRASMYRLECALPSLSRPLYECILTGVAPVDSGIVHNSVARLSTQQSIFHLAQSAGRTTAAAAYHWISELYNRSPYVAHRDRFTDDLALPIQHGIFYHSDDYPDSHLLIDADTLRRRHAPDFLLVHTMNVDDAGHRFAYDSPQYRNAARTIDGLLSLQIPEWLASGYQVLVTSDHGMNNDRSHGGVLPEERQVPLFTIGSRFDHAKARTNADAPDAGIRQTDICGLVADLMGLPHSSPSRPADAIVLRTA